MIFRILSFGIGLFLVIIQGALLSDLPIPIQILSLFLWVPAILLMKIGISGKAQKKKKMK